MKKFILKPIFWIILAGVVLLATLFGIRKYNDYRVEKEAQEMVDAAIEEEKAKYRADKGGGDTPEAALEGFKNALLEKDIEKSMEFVFLDERVKFREELNVKKNEGELKKYAEGIPTEIERDDEECYICDTVFCTILERVVYNHYYYVGEGETMELFGEIIEVPAGKHGISMEFNKTFNDKWQLEGNLPASFDK